jgi:hypothetical protein
VTSKDYVIIAPAGTTDVRLPDAANLIGRLLVIRSLDAKGVRILSDSGKDNIDGQTSISIAYSGDNTTVYAVTLIAAQGGDWISIASAKK